MNDAPPDRLCASPRSKYYDEKLLDRGVGVRINGVEKKNVEEYCVSEGWIRVPAGKALDRRGDPITFKLTGTVEVWFRDQVPDPPKPGP